MHHSRIHPLAIESLICRIPHLKTRHPMADHRCYWSTANSRRAGVFLVALHDILPYSVIDQALSSIQPSIVTAHYPNKLAHSHSGHHRVHSIRFCSRGPTRYDGSFHSNMIGSRGGDLKTPLWTSCQGCQLFFPFFYVVHIQ